MEYTLARALFKILGLRYGLRFYNSFASDTKTEQFFVALRGAAGPIKLPPFYDISHWKIVNDWNGISPRPILMGTKATQSVDYRDPTFPEYFQKFTTHVKCRRLAYHFFEKTQDPVRQANWFCDYVAPYITSQDILCLDFEQGGETASQLWAWCDRVKQRYPSNLIVFYSRKNLADPISMTAAEKEFFKSYPFWTAGYPTDPSSYTTTPSAYIPDQTKWGPVWFWQYTDGGAVTGIDGDTDCNLVEPNAIEWLGGSLPPEDVATFPYNGVQRICGRRFDSNIYVTIAEVSKVRVRIAHEKPFENGLLLVSQTCNVNSAQFGWNGDEWDKNVPLPAFPKNLAISDGQIYVSRKSAEPSLIIFTNGTATIVHQTPSSIRQASTGRRYLIENGVISSYLSGTEPQYTEKHPRGLTGITIDGSKIIMITVDGRTSVSTGITLKQGAQILKEFGAYTAYDRGGGGDAVDVMDGIVQNVPCDTDNSGNPGVERAVPQAILLYATKENTMAYRYTATANGDGTRTRIDHNTASNYTNSYQRGTVFEGDELFTAPSDLSNANGVYQKKGDKWLKVATVNGQPPRNAAGNPESVPVWVAILHMGNQQICSLVDHGTTPPPIVETVTVSVTVEIDGYDPLTLTGEARPNA